jgi:hypothetical protein
MITTFKIPYRDGELRIGWASWDDGSMTSRSIKYAYPDGSGKISRGSPELPFDILIDMLILAAEQDEIDLSVSSHDTPESPGKLSKKILQEEEKKLKSSLMVLQKLRLDLPWLDSNAIKTLYDQVGVRYDGVKKALGK